MARTQQATIVGVFTDRERAQQAVNELRREGFGENEIGVAARDGETIQGATKVKGKAAKAGTGAAIGVASGAGIGALWGLGIVAGVLPAIGPAIAGGTLAAVLSSAGAGAVAAGLAGALIGLGIPEEEAKYYEEEFKAGRIIVTVKAGNRTALARDILSRYDAYDFQTRDRTQTTTATSRRRKASTRTEETGRSRGRETSSRTRGRTASTTGGRTVDVREEEVEVKKQPVKTGEVRVRKEVEVEPRTIDVPVTREEVVVERRPARGRAAASDIGKGEEIRVPVTSEQVHVDKRPVVKEEVSVGKRSVRGNQKVATNVRKEKVKVEKSGNVNVRDETCDTD